MLHASGSVPWMSLSQSLFARSSNYSQWTSVVSTRSSCIQNCGRHCMGSSSLYKRRIMGAWKNSRCTSISTISPATPSRCDGPLLSLLATNLLRKVLPVDHSETTQPSLLFSTLPPSPCVLSVLNGSEIPKALSKISAAAPVSNPILSRI